MFHVLLHRTERKEALLKQKEKEKINERSKEELKRAEKKDKDKQAISEYEKWLVGVDELPPSLDLYSFSASHSHPVFLGDYLGFPPLQLRFHHGLSSLAALLRVPKAGELAAGVSSRRTSCLGPSPLCPFFLCAPCL